MKPNFDRPDAVKIEKGIYHFIFPNGEKASFDTADLVISEANINKELGNHAGRYSEIASFASVIKARKESMEATLKSMYAACEITSREVNPKKTDAFHKAQALTDDKYLELLQDLNMMREIAAALESLMWSYSHRKDCMLQLAENLRAEFFNTKVSSA